ncbi:hypothetical protein DOK_05435 [gamma proteobacterium BDW918]|uniref:Uncharacterized protein n=2 Tax=Spongiibacteraceae TaxID=1706375 RepID=A0A127M224_9GAMM|nr:hypothetical protein AZF00_02745 [Zhongshania aliphaticivorans]EIF44050.1 hypothetical protein DOK_05435 [gamma proteobacterium BDW918]
MWRPPLTTVDQQYLSVQSNLEQSEGFIPNAGISISSEIITSSLPDIIKEAVADVDQAELKVLWFDSKIRLVTQGIWIDATFKLQDRVNGVAGKGTFSGIAAVDVAGDQLRLRPAFQNIRIHDVELQNGTMVTDVLVLAAFKTLTGGLVETINSELLAKPMILDLKLNTSTVVDLAADLGDANTTVTAEKVKVSRNVKSSLVRIDETGLSMLLELQDGKLPAGKESEVVASSLGLKKTPSELNDLFQRYNRIFNKRWASYLDPVDARVDIDIQVAKHTLASLLREALSSQLQIEYQASVPSVQFKSTVEVKPSRIDCQDLRKPFSRTRYSRASCNWSCLRCVDPCRPLGHCSVCTDDPICVANKTACNVLEESRVAADNILHETARVAHQADQEAQVAKCDVLREANNFMALGRFEGVVGFSGTANLIVSNINVADDLTTIRITTGAAVKGRLDVGLKITPLDLGHVFLCVAPFGKRWSPVIKADIPYEERTIALRSRQGENDKRGYLILEGSIAPLRVDVKLDPPIKSLLTDPLFLAKCSAGATRLTQGLSLALTLESLGLTGRQDIVAQLLGEFSQEIDVKSFEHQIKSESITLTSTRKIVVQPMWGGKTIRLQSQ